MNKKKYLVVSLGLLMIFLMVGSMCMSRGEDSDVVEYNGYTFYKVEDSWQVNYQGELMVYEYTPKDVENLGVPFFGEGTMHFLNGGLDDNLFSFYETIFLTAGYNFIMKCDNCPVIESCEDDVVANLVSFEDGGELEVFERDNCIIFKGDYESLNKVAHYYMFSFMGLM